MKKKIVSILVSMLLCVTALAVTGTEIADENVIQSFEPAPSSVISGESRVGTENIVYEGFRNGDWYTVDVQADQAGSFPALNPAGWTALGSTEHCYAGTWANGLWYAIDDDTKNLGTIDTSTGAFTVIGNTGIASGDVTTGMAYDPSSDTMYLTNAVGAAIIHLYTVNLATAAVTDLGSLTPLIIAIGCSMDGTIYATSISPDSSYIIDPSGPTATEIGPLGIDLNYAQGAAFDKDNGKFYASTYVASAQLYEINLASGAATPLIGSFPSGEHCAFAIPYTSNNPPNTPSTPSGQTTGIVGTPYTYSSTTTDPEGENVAYWFEWGDTTNSGWTAFVPSGDPGSATKTWTSPGTYEVTAKAKDINGAESGFSGPLTVVIVAGPILEIDNISGGLLKVSTVIRNIGGIDATRVNWSISLAGGLLIFDGKNSGEIINIPVGDERKISSSLILGFGKTIITITAECAEGSSVTKEQEALVLLFFIIII